MYKILPFIFCFFLFVSAQPSCRFAPQYTQADIVLNQQKQQEFLQSIMYWEGKFHQDGVGMNFAAGLTYDGHSINYQTGEIEGGAHTFSAASKESLHVGILAKILNGDPLAQYLISNDSSVAHKTAIQILENKINSYEKFNHEYPGFGGFLPWFTVNNSGMVLLSGWTDKVPSLDNGQLLWSLVAVIEVLETQKLTDLATRYRNYLDIMTQSMSMIFNEGNGNIRTVALISDIYKTPFPGNYRTESPCGNPCYLDDPYEGELFAFYLSYFGGISQADTDLIWKKKTAKLQSVTYTTPAGKITTQRGWWFSAHEQWKFMVLPYNDVPIVNRIFKNGEKARTWDASLSKNPGMFASINDVAPPGKPIPSYISATGIQQLAFETVQRRDVITGYGCYPLFLADKNTALVWFLNYLKGPKCQNPYGATEAININGTMISPLTTWDSKMTTVQAILGGIVDITRKVMKDRGIYDKFTARLTEDYQRTFTTIEGDSIPFAIPYVPVPSSHLEDFSSCKRNQESETILV